MDNLDTLNSLLDMTTEAEELASNFGKSERLRSLIEEIRQKAKDEHDRLRRDKRQIETQYQFETQYQLCMIGILEECNFGRVPWPNVIGLDARLGRIHEEIVRTMKQINANRRIM